MTNAMFVNFQQVLSIIPFYVKSSLPMGLAYDLSFLYSFYFIPKIESTKVKQLNSNYSLLYNSHTRLHR